jgi:hypothetical protein
MGLLTTHPLEKTKRQSQSFDFKTGNAPPEYPARTHCQRPKISAYWKHNFYDLCRNICTTSTQAKPLSFYVFISIY